MVVVVVSLGFLVQQGTTGPDEYLFGGEPIAASQIARMEAAMASAGLNDFAVEGNHIKVPRGQKSAYIAAIADAGELPPDVFNMMDKALDKGSIFDSSAVKKQRLKAAREQQLSLIIKQMPWVENAMVLYDVQEERGLRAVRKASASISIMPAVGESITSGRSRNLKSMVASAHNIPIENVSITNLGNDNLMGGDGISPEDFDNPLYVTKAKVERDLRDSIINQLSFIPGVRVEVSAVLNKTSMKRTVQVKPEKETALLKKQETTEKSKRISMGPGGTPGVVAQGPGRDGLEQPSQPQNTDDDSTEQIITDSVVGTTTTEEETAAFVTERTEASIAIPQSYVATVFKKQELDKTGTEPEQVTPEQLQQLETTIKTNVENIVQPLLAKLTLGENEYDQAKVVFYHDLPPAEIPAPSMASNALGVLSSYGNTLAMAGVALMSLVMIRSIASGSGGGTGPNGSGAIQLSGAGAGSSGGVSLAGDEEDDDERERLTLRKAETLKDDLAEMVASDPDAAAEILKSWISSSA